MNKRINKEIKIHRSRFDKYYKKLLKSNLPKDDLSKIMLYGTLNGGKRIRPFLISIFSQLAALPNYKYYRISAAVECIHSYSLIHDDLPCMDNDDFRRGKLSVHRKFGEAQAILAGDSLHDIAFEFIANQKTHNDPMIRIKLVYLLSSTLGAKGLAGGQYLDLKFENKKINKNKILKMYNLKTAALFCFCCMAPFIMTKKNNKDLQFAKEYGNVFGIIFQIIDDYLDEFENFKKIGKTPGKDRKQGKSTILLHMKKKEVIPYCQSLANQFIKRNKKYFIKWNILEDLLVNITQV